jgi:hypothetical protein
MMKELQKVLDTMEPAEALVALTPQLKKILSCLDQGALIGFITDLIDGPGGDKVSSMVNL